MKPLSLCFPDDFTFLDLPQTVLFFLMEESHGEKLNFFSILSLCCKLNISAEKPSQIPGKITQSMQ